MIEERSIFDRRLTQRVSATLQKFAQRIGELEKLLLAGVLLLAVPLCYTASKNLPGMWTSRSPAAASTIAGIPEDTPEVRAATQGEWKEASGWWSRFGALVSVFDGEDIVFNSVKSQAGGLGCWISPGSKPLAGVCLESLRLGTPKPSSVQRCTWRLIVDEISPHRIHGSRMLKPDTSDPFCVATYGTLPAFFTWERPRGQSPANSLPLP